MMERSGLQEGSKLGASQTRHAQQRPTGRSFAPLARGPSPRCIPLPEPERRLRARLVPEMRASARIMLRRGLAVTAIAAKPKRRSGSQKRKRAHHIDVCFDDEEWALLKERTGQRGLS
jgi:hypothetical protein